jgi:hypothetical protein
LQWGELWLEVIVLKVAHEFIDRSFLLKEGIMFAGA